MEGEEERKTRKMKENHRRVSLRLFNNQETK
jgi:hypothetical protein